MAVDGVGKPPISGVPNQALGIGGTELAPKAEFKIDAATKTTSSSAIASVDGDLMRQLELGQVTQEQYLDKKAEAAVAHLVGHLPTDQIETIRATLRDQLSDDPVFLRLLRQVTAQHGQR